MVKIKNEGKTDQVLQAKDGELEWTDIEDRSVGHRLITAIVRLEYNEDGVEVTSEGFGSRVIPQRLANEFSLMLAKASNKRFDEVLDPFFQRMARETGLDDGS